MLHARRSQAKFLFLAPLLTLGLALGLAQSPDSRAGTLAPKFTVYGAQVEEPIQIKTALARQVGRPDTIDELIQRLLTSIRTLSHYDVEVEAPNVRRLPLTEIHHLLCGRPCTMRAAYVPGDGLYIDEAMRPLTNQYEQSILFHELVHHVQDMTASHNEHDECRRWQRREVEAYALQNNFLFELGLSSHVIFPGKICAPAQA